MRQPSTFVEVSGQMPERPSRSETGAGVPVAEFHIEVGREWSGRAGQGCQKGMFILCRATGYAANSIRVYWHRGCDVIITGELDQRACPMKQQNETYVLVHTVAYVSPRQIMEAGRA